MAAQTTQYSVDYEDERFNQVETDKQAALTENEKTYDDMIGNSDSYYQAQIDASKEWANTQTQLQQEQTDFTIEQIEQQKEQAQKDYVKEQSGAYVDWQKQSNEYGAEAEKQAAAGLAGTGYSESSQVSMYNAYQNRVASARESFVQAKLNYDNAIKDAKLQNNSLLAEIAYQSLQTQLELSLQGFQYKNQLILDKANKKIELENTYYNRYLDVLNQINNENALAEEVRQFDTQLEENIRQFDTQMAEDIRQFDKTYELQSKELDEQIRQFEKSYELQVKEYNESIRQFDLEIERLKAKDAREYEIEIKNLELNKQRLEEEKRQFNKQQALEREKLQEQKRQFDESQKTAKASITKSSSGSGSGGGGGSIDKQSSSSPTLDNSSVLALGLGPISADKLSELVASGQVTTTTKNNKIYVSWSTNKNLAAGQSALNKYTTLWK